MNLQERLKDILNVQKYSTFWLAAVVIAAGIATSYFYIQNEKTKKLLKDPELAAKEQLKGVVEQVAKLIDVPKGEEPQVATVSDVKKLKDQPFFANAKNGDKVMIYNKAGRAILYRPSTNKIIEIAPINRGEAPEANPQIVAAFKGVKVAIYNGAGKEGLAGATESKIRAKYPDIEVVTKENASEKDYKENIIIDVKGGKSAQTKALATVLGGKVGSLPDGELKPDADILIIVAR